MHTRLTSVAVAFALLSGASFADTPKPRVMVIMDTSKSMTEKPDALNPTCFPWPGACIPQLPNDPGTLGTPGQRGDYDPTLNNQCDNKFCAAKSVVYNVIPGFVDDARIGITTYFQYLVKADTADNRSSTCMYDVLAPPAISRTFTSLFDYTGGGLGDTCAMATPYSGCTTTASSYFPDSTSGTGSNLLKSFCKSPPGYTTPTDPLVRPNACVGIDCYKLVKRSAAPGMPASCTINTWVSGGLTAPRSFTASTSWCTVGSYPTITGTVISPMAGYFEQVVPTATASCGTAVAQSLTPPAPIAGNSQSLTASPAIGTAAGNWLATNAPNTLQCSAGSPCTMYVGVTAPKTYNTDRYWYMFYSNQTFTTPVTAVFSPAPTYRGTLPTSYDFSTASNGPNYTGLVAPVLTGQIAGVALGTSCLAAPGQTLAASSPVGGGSTGSVGRYTSGGLQSFGINSPLATLTTVLPPVPGATNESPGWTGANFNCGTGAGTSSTPCDVKVTNDITNPGPWVLSGPINTVTGLAANQDACNSAASCTHTALGPFNPNPTFTLIATNPAVVSCPSAGSLTTTSNPTVVNMAWSGGSPTCGPGQAACQWSASGSGTTNAPGGLCPNKSFYTSSGVPGVCSFNGKSYAPGAPATTPGTMTATAVGAATCPVTQTVANAGAAATLGLTGTGCGAYPCTVTATGSMPGAPQVSGFTVYDQNTPPAGYSGPPTSSQNSGGLVNQSNVGNADTTTNDCIGSVGSLVELTSPSCPNGTTCTVKVTGVAVVGKDCTAEKLLDCYSCQYQPLAFQWARPTTTCNYSTTRYDYTVDQSTLSCTYTHPQWMIETQLPDTHTCQYGVGARRNDYNAESSRTCRYWNLQTNFTAPRTTYTYEYQTKGTELLGRASLATPLGTNYCSSSYAGAFQTACPAVLPNCTGVTPEGTWPMSGIAAGSTCKLRYGGGVGSGPTYGLASTTVNKRDGRYQAFNGNGTAMPLGNPSVRSCEEVVVAGNPTGATAIPASPDSYRANSGSPTGFCFDSGAGPTSSYKLVSDWYDPTATNNLANIQALPMFSSTTVSWNNTPNKAQGFGGVAGPAVVGSGAAAGNRATFVGIPNDASYNSATQRSAIQKVASKCIPPSAAAPNPDGTLQGGACLSDFLDPSSSIPIDGDVTPLYGSLKNTNDYLHDRWQNDDDAQECRGYYIILVTDGKESTPAGYNFETNPTALPNLVSSFRNTTNASAPDVKTFVIGFGRGASGSGNLDLLAAAGGTNAAFSANSQSELATALRTVFTTITQGTFSRTKPAIGTDGTRLYVAQYIKPSIGADWSGLMTAYSITTGQPQPVWEFSNKLDNQGARTIRAALRKKSDGTMVVGTFNAGNAELVDQLNDCTTCAVPYPAGMLPSNIVDFLTTKGHTYFGDTVARATALGPVVASSPVVVGKSPYDISYGGNNPPAKTAFTNFGSTLTRGTRVMFQSNDGMVHSVYENTGAPACTSLGESDFSCPNGTEAWAMVPGMISGAWSGSFGRPMLAQSLYDLYAGGWAGNLLNGTLSVADVCDSAGDATNCISTDWKTIAIGTQREGGRGMYAVDVTDGTAPDLTKVLWDFADGDLGLTYSVPAVGRVGHNGKEEFVAIFGAGADDPNTGSIISPDFEGNHVFVLNALRGNKISEFSSYIQGGSRWTIDEEVLNRPALWRQPGHAFIDSAYIGVGRKLFAMRFAKSPVSDTGAQWDDATHWEPDELFDPASNRNDDPAVATVPPSAQTRVNQVVVTVPGTATTPPSYGLSQVGTLPISAPAWTVAAPPIYNRPKLAAEVVSSGQLPDLYVGTGDVRDPANPAAAFQSGNFFYAVHDFNQQPHGARNDGRALWVAMFPGKEQIVSEPAVISGCLVVATFTPPAIGARCGVQGDTTLYGFDPITGALVQCLFYPTISGGANGADGGSDGGPITAADGGIPTSWEGKPTAVVKLSGVGIPSDLVVVNDNVWLKPSGGDLQKAPVRQLPQPGSVRSYRRLK